jgi:RimJ/RimL family protein N-acetyltransferase
MSNTPWPDSVVLENAHARLEPLRAEHAEALAEASADGELWRLWYTQVPKPKDMPAEIARRLDLREKGSMLPFAVFRPGSERPIGMTSYMNIDAKNRRVEIGSTWYARSVQRTPLNTACKLMLLTHAFDVLGCIAVEWRTHFMNHQSRRAIERLGAKLDGVLRSHTVTADGTLRDTCVYSVIATEWPAVRSHLNWQLEKPR